MPDSPRDLPSQPADTGTSASTPEERLESLRFFVQEGGYENLPKALFDWMHEVENQVIALRKRLNDMPNEYARKSPSW